MNEATAGSWPPVDPGTLEVGDRVHAQSLEFDFAVMGAVTQVSPDKRTAWIGYRQFPWDVYTWAKQPQDAQQPRAGAGDDRTGGDDE